MSGDAQPAPHVRANAHWPLRTRPAHRVRQNIKSQLMPVGILIVEDRLDHVRIDALTLRFVLYDVSVVANCFESQGLEAPRGRDASLVRIVGNLKAGGLIVEDTADPIGSIAYRGCMSCPLSGCGAIITRDMNHAMRSRALMGTHMNESATGVVGARRWHFRDQAAGGTRLDRASGSPRPRPDDRRHFRGERNCDNAHPASGSGVRLRCADQAIQALGTPFPSRGFMR